MKSQPLIPHLFRTEYRKIVSVLSRRFGFEQIEIAEDIASETFFTASQVWGLEGSPENPVAWLYNVARNKAINHLTRRSIFHDKIVPDLKIETDQLKHIDIDLSPESINDSQLQMMFAICHPSIPQESQIGLSLRILCGFGIEEIANAFLTNKETINKRLFRAKEKLREEKIAIELPADSEIEARLSTVLTTIYLLFNEGYYSVSQDKTLRKELCLEAMRLCYMLIETQETNTPSVNALMSLMCFHASRFEARIDKDGGLILYDDQDPGLWSSDLIKKGGYFLNGAANGDMISRYHLEAGIAYWHTQKSDSREKWESILQLYNQLLEIVYSPIAALNRTYALSKANGKPEAIIEAEKLQLTDNHFYFALLGELYTGIDSVLAKQHLLKALSMAKTAADSKVINDKLQKL
ncbi:MAG: sigma-70 family RNA polymerase sigma factor [Cyclobacteriaceae bacterium]|nr:sigma-70 family RNA polymerase sigma factor [Cyclobacteriaceae bacterium]